MTRSSTTASILALAAFAALTGCSTDRSGTRYAPAALSPAGPGTPGAPRTAPPIDLTRPGAVARGVQAATVIDTRAITSLSPEPHRGPVRTLRDVLPPHGKAAPYPQGPANNLPVGRVEGVARVTATPQFPGIGQTPWVPPDCTLAVGPNHIVATVNMAIAFYKKDGTIQFYQYLDSSGSPGFFEDAGAGGYTFDPKCFYDHIARRFVVVAPEVYGQTEAWITIAVSDDDDPNGVWYKYRTDAVITVGSQTFWWDYPGFGYDHQGYYVTGNLFGLNVGGWGGVGFRVFDKTPMLSGQPAAYSTLRDGGAASVQVAQHFGTPVAPYFISVASSSALRVHAIRNPLTAPTLVSTNVTIAGFSGPVDSPTSGGSLWSIDARIFNAHWRDGKLFATHHVSKLTPQGNRNVARWYQLNTGSWPDSGTVTNAQTGNVDAGDGVFAYFPAIYSNADGDAGLVFGMSSASTPVQVAVTGRAAGDPTGTMGAPVVVATSPVASSGRWGDYYDIAVDPDGDRRFWIVGEISESFGWSTWIGSFTVGGADGPLAVLDEAGNAYPGVAKTIDVLANDSDANGDAITIASFDDVSVHAGTITRSVGTGPGGRDRLVYAAPTDGYTGTDSFHYTDQDAGGLTGTAMVTVQVQPPTTFREPDNAPYTGPGVTAKYYSVSRNQASMPNYTSMTPYATETVPQLNYPSSLDPIAGSGRADAAGARFVGYFLAPADDGYTLFTNSDDGSILRIGAAVVVSNDGQHGMTEKSGSIALKAGLHAITVDYFDATGAAGLIVSVEGGGLFKQPIPTSHWRHTVCPADYNGDDFIDGVDSDLFNNDFESGDIDADFNRDGFVDGIDYDLFNFHFEGGC